MYKRVLWQLVIPDVKSNMEYSANIIDIISKQHTELNALMFHYRFFILSIMAWIKATIE